MALRQYSEISTLQGVDYKIEIHDTDWVGLTSEFTSRDYGLNLSYRPVHNKRLYSPLMPSTLSFTLVVNKAGQETLITDLGTSAEDRFTVAVYRDDGDGGGYVIWWVGQLLPDSARIEDISMPYDLELEAVDGLANLKEIPYAPSIEPLIDYIHNAPTFLEKILVILGQISTTDLFYLSGDEFFIARCNWYASEHVLALTDCPLEFTRCKNYNFYKFSKSDESAYMNCYDVLYEICEAWGARLYQSNGLWHFEQVYSRVAAAVYAHRYNKGQTKLSEASETHTRAVDKVDNQVLAGGSWTFLHAAKKVELKLAHDGTANLLNESWTFGTAEFTYPQVYDENSATRLKLTGNVEHLSSMETGVYPGPIDDYHRLVFKLKIKVGSYWLKRNYHDLTFYSDLVPYYEATWEATENYCYFVSNVIKNNEGVWKTTSINFTTPPIEETGALIYDFSMEKYITFPNVETTPPATGFSFSFFFHNHLSILPDGDEENVSTHKLYLAENGAEATKTLKINTNIGDAVYENTSTKLEVNDGAAWVDSTGWQYKAAGTVRLFSELLIHQIIELRKTPRYIYRGTITALNNEGLWPYATYGYDSITYLFIGGTYNARMEELNGTFIQIAGEGTGITVTVSGEVIKEGNPALRGGYPVELMAGIGGATFRPQTVDTSGLEAQKITTSDDALTDGDTITQIPITNIPKDGAISAGDTITLINPATGQQQSFVVNTDVVTTDTVIEVDSIALTANFPTGSGVLTDTDSAGIAGGPALYESYIDQVGDYVTITVKTLTATNINKKIQVFRGGQLQIYTENYTIDVGLNRINWVMSNLGEDVIVFFY